MILEEWTFTRPEAATIVGLSEDQIGNWIGRYGLFSGRRPGRGGTFQFGFRDLLALAAIKLLADNKLCEPKNAIPLVDYSSLYGVMLDQLNPIAGHFVLTKSSNGLQPNFDVNASPSLQVRINIWSLCDEILPGVFAAIRNDPVSRPSEQIEARIQDAIATLDKYRPSLKA